MFTGIDYTIAINAVKCGCIDTITWEDTCHGVTGKMVMSEYQECPAKTYKIRPNDPEYSITITAVNSHGHAKYVSLMECKTVKTLHGVSQNDLGCSISVEFYCRNYEPARDLKMIGD